MPLGVLAAPKHPLRGGEDAGHVALRPGIGQRPRLHGPARQHHLLDVLGGDLLALCPERELLDLEPQLVRVLPDELDQQAARVGVGLRARAA